MFRDLYEWVLAWAPTPYAESALFLIAFAESSFFPIPPDVLLIAMGVANPDYALYYALLTSVGSVLGGAVGYGIGHWGGRPILKRIMTHRSLSAAEDYYNRYDMWAIGIAGFTPIPYKVFTITAGAFQIRFRNFLLASALSRPARFFLVGGALYFWGQQIQDWIAEYFNVATLAFAILLIGGFLIVRHIGKRATRSQETSGTL